MPHAPTATRHELDRMASCPPPHLAGRVAQYLLQLALAQRVAFQHLLGHHIQDLRPTNRQPHVSRRSLQQQLLSRVCCPNTAGTAQLPCATQVKHLTAAGAQLRTAGAQLVHGWCNQAAARTSACRPACRRMPIASYITITLQPGHAGACVSAGTAALVTRERRSSSAALSAACGPSAAILAAQPT